MCYVRVMYFFTAPNFTFTLCHVNTFLSMCAVCIIISIRERSLLKEMMHLLFIEYTSFAYVCMYICIQSVFVLCGLGVFV